MVFPGDFTVRLDVHPDFWNLLKIKASENSELKTESRG